MSKVITVKDKNFYKQDGTPFIPKGINMVCKAKERGYIGPYTEKDFKFLKDHGFNLIRLGIFWDGAEPEPGVYSEAYFNELDKIIKMAAAEDIPVFLDMHQDLFSSVYEDGAPAWATLSDDCEHIRTDLWSESYLVSEAVQCSFDKFWENAEAPDGIGIRSHFVKLWKTIAARYAQNPYVIGYDVFNEPFPGTPGRKVFETLMTFAAEAGVSDIAEIADPSVLYKIIEAIEPITGKFEEEILNPFYSEVCGAIREVDPDTIFMFESNYFANAGIPSHVSPALDKNGLPYKNQAYVPHGYDILVDTEDYSAGGTERIDMIFEALGYVIEALPVPTLIGEWGCYPNASEAQLSQARHLLSIFDRFGIGHAYFDFSHLYDGGIISIF